MQVYNRRVPEGPPDELIELARFVGSPADSLSILAEGNVACHRDENSFWVKASGRALSGIERSSFVAVQRRPLLDAINGPPLDEKTTRAVLNSAIAHADSDEIPSTESYMHALLLSFESARFVAHAHPPDLLSLLITAKAEDLAAKRWFPDEIVCCGRASCFVPYAAPGLPLARAIKSAAAKFEKTVGEPPKCFWLQNHGLIAVGKTHQEAIAAVKMSAKAAKVLLQAVSTGLELHPLSQKQINEIANWTDEHYRQNLLWRSEKR